MKIFNIVVFLIITGLAAYGSFMFGVYYGTDHIAKLVGPALLRCIELIK